MAKVEVTPIENVEEWFSIFEKSDEKCYVIDCHSPWAGRVEVMDTVWNRLGTELGDIEKRLEIRSLSMTPEITEEIRNTFRFLLRMDQQSAFLKTKTHSNQAISTSQEALMKQLMVEMETGRNTSSLESKEDNDEGSQLTLSCEPLFFVLRFQSLVAVIRGVDPPAILSSIRLNVPEVSRDENEDI